MSCRVAFESFLLLLVLSIGLPGTSQGVGALQSPKRTTQSVESLDQSFTVPVSITTTGNAWNGYLAFGLWQFNSTLAPVRSYLVVMTTSGQLLYLRRSNDFPPTYWPVKYIAPYTLMYMGEPNSLATHFWNMSSNKTVDFPNVWGHHDIVYNPYTGTFLTLRDYIRVIDGHNVLMDNVTELNFAGDVLWSWDTYADGHIGLSDECKCNDTSGGSSGYLPGPVLIDLTHSNSLQWNFNTNIIYLNMRAQDTFCKIDKTTHQEIWCLGKHGNFVLYNLNGQKVPSLWYHAHDLQEVSPDVFTMFDNEYYNESLPCPSTFNGTDLHSRMLEITVNEQNMTARESWVWEAPSAYWTPYWGSVNILPNGDIMGAFGANSHYVSNSTGAVVVEVNRADEVVRTYTFPYGWGIYRVEPIPLLTANDYDNLTHTSAFQINLSTLNALGGAGEIYYKINNGTTQTVSADGQPVITTNGLNNTLEYWSVDGTGIEENPHQFLTGIKLNTAGTTENTQTSYLSNDWTPFGALSLLAVVVLVTVYLRRVRSRSGKSDQVVSKGVKS